MEEQELLTNEDKSRYQEKKSKPHTWAYVQSQVDHINEDDESNH